MSEYGLLFYFSEDFNETDAALLKEAIDELRAGSNWTDSPPEFIDSVDDSDPSEPIRTVGGFLRLQPPNAVSDPRIERTYYEEVERIVESLCVFSAKIGCEFELELGGTYVGDIVDGEPDELVTLGLLGEWKKSQ